MSKNLPPYKLCSVEGDQDKWILVNSEEGIQFKENLEKIIGMSNSPSFCSQCNCFLNNDQKKAHKKEHQSSIKTAKAYTQWKDFLILLEENNHIRKDTGHEEFKIPRVKPYNSQQKETEKTEAITNPQNEKNTSLSQFIQLNRQELSNSNLILSQSDFEKPSTSQLDSSKKTSSINFQSVAEGEASQISEPRNTRDPLNSIAKAIESVLQIAEKLKANVREMKSNIEELKNDVEVSNFATKFY